MIAEVGAGSARIVGAHAMARAKSVAVREKYMAAEHVLEDRADAISHPSLRRLLHDGTALCDKSGTYSHSRD
jgi:hypothetical protein